MEANKKKTWLGENKNNLMLWVITGVLGATIYLIIDMRDFMKFKQPRIDEIQNTNINTLQRYTCTVDSMSKDRNENLNIRQNKLEDRIIPFLQKIDSAVKNIQFENKIILKHNKQALKEIQEYKEFISTK
jgi:hypothetical protein